MARYESSGCEVYFLNISASASVLTQRLLKRGREPPEEVEKRVARAKLAEPQGAHVIHIINEGSTEAGCKLVTGALLGELKYSLWLTPAPDSTSHKLASEIITAQSAALRDDRRGFQPHVTLCRSFTCSQRDAISAARAVATALSARGLVACEFNGPTHYMVDLAAVGNERDELPDRRQAGKTQFKRRLAEALGWRLVEIHWRDWDEVKMRTFEERAARIKALFYAQGCEGCFSTTFKFLH